MFNQNLAINRYIYSAQLMDGVAEDCRADIYIGHGVQALPAADRLRTINGGLAACDVIETPSFAKRAVPSTWDPIMLKMLDHGLSGYLQDADFLTTVGWALRDLIRAEHGHNDVRVVPNYRRFEEHPWNNQIRETCSIPKQADVLLCISTIASGFEDVLQALLELSDDTHLVVVGKFVPQSYRLKIDELRNKFGLKARVHFLEPLPYKDLASFCAGADVGLIVRDPTITNNYVSLPNRVFDYLAASLPIVSPMMPDIHRILSERDCGVTIPDISPTAWASGIREVLDRKDLLRRNAAKAAHHFSWESLEEGNLHSTFNRADSVTFVGFNNLAKNNRTMRLTESLVAKGVTVKVASVFEEGDRLPDGVIGIPLPKV